jgi:hypothetical protein
VQKKKAGNDPPRCKKRQATILLGVKKRQATILLGVKKGRGRFATSCPNTCISLANLIKGS